MIYFLSDNGLKSAETSAELSHAKLSPLIIDDVRGTGRLRLSASALSGENGFSGSDEYSLNETDTHLFAPFRALSAVLIEDRHLDFSADGVLKSSYRLLKGQTVYPNHDADVNQWIGVTAKSWWEESSGDRPAGVDVTLKISKKHNERIVDGIKEGALHSVSVDVLFEYKKSHSELEGFFWKLGENIDNSIVRLIITKITGYDEISLVWQGADRWAKRLFTPESTGLENGSEQSLSQSKNNNTGGKNDMSVKLSKAAVGGLLSAIGMTYEKFGFEKASDTVELDDSKLSLFIREIEDRITSDNEKLSQIREFLKADENSDIVALAKELSAKAVVADATLSDMRAEALKFAKLAEGEGDEKTLNTALEKSIQSASYEDAKAFAELYSKKAEALAPLKCKKCGAELHRGSAERDSSQSSDDTDDDKFRFGGK